MTREQFRTYAKILVGAGPDWPDQLAMRLNVPRAKIARAAHVGPTDALTTKLLGAIQKMENVKATTAQ